MRKVIFIIACICIVSILQAQQSYQLTEITYIDHVSGDTSTAYPQDTWLDHYQKDGEIRISGEVSRIYTYNARRDKKLYYLKKQSHPRHGTNTKAIRLEMPLKDLQGREFSAVMEVKGYQRLPDDVLYLELHSSQAHSTILLRGHGY